jgi:hypothetical protein
MKKIVIALCLTGLLAGNVWAQDRSPRFQMRPGVLICDTLTQLIEQIESGKRELVEGCGFTQRPMFVEVVPQASFDAHGYTFPLVQFDFPVQRESGIEMWTQYGFWGKPKPVQASLDVDA